MSSIFISYRREDSADIAGRIYDQLEARFGRDAVFKDVDAIPAGEDFRKHINGALGQCLVSLVIIGPRWLGTSDAHGQRRIDSPEDFVRIEVEALLAKKTPVIPLLAHGTSMPSSSELPQGIAELAYINALPVRADPDFRRDMERIVTAIEAFVGDGSVRLEPVSASPKPTSGSLQATFEVRSRWSNLGGSTIGVAALKDGRIESNHRMFAWAPWPDALDSIWTAFRSIDPSCERRRGVLQLRAAVFRSPVAYLQVEFPADSFNAEADVYYSAKGVGIERVTLTITAPDRATIDKVVASANRGGTNLIREIR